MVCEMESAFWGQWADVKSGFRRDLKARLTGDKVLPLSLLCVMTAPK